jgi:cell division transport system permease protein
MRALRYFLTEAVASLWRGWRAASLAILTIAAGLFVLGFFLIANDNVQRLTGRWTESAELSVYLTDDATPEHLAVISDLIDKSGLAATRTYVSKDEAARRFREDFPDLAPAAEKLDSNPCPPSFDVHLNPSVREAEAAIDTLATTLGGLAGVADVRYDRRWLSRLNTAIRFVRGIGLLIVAMLAVAAALTVANVVRLAAAARRDEIEIMRLVGAPFAYVRGPFIVEGVLQGGAGAVVAVGLLWGAFLAGRARYGAMAAEALGLGSLTFLPLELVLGLVAGGMLLGCVGGVIVARGVR